MVRKLVSDHRRPWARRRAQARLDQPARGAEARSRGGGGQDPRPVGGRDTAKALEDDGRGPAGAIHHEPAQPGEGAEDHRGVRAPGEPHQPAHRRPAGEQAGALRAGEAVRAGGARRSIRATSSVSWMRHCVAPGCPTSVCTTCGTRRARCCCGTTAAWPSPSSAWGTSGRRRRWTCTGTRCPATNGSPPSGWSAPSRITRRTIG